MIQAEALSQIITTLPNRPDKLGATLCAEIEQIVEGTESDPDSLRAHYALVTAYVAQAEFSKARNAIREFDDEWWQDQVIIQVIHAYLDKGEINLAYQFLANYPSSGSRLIILRMIAAKHALMGNIEPLLDLAHELKSYPDEQLDWHLAHAHAVRHEFSQAFAALNAYEPRVFMHNLCTWIDLIDSAYPKTAAILVDSQQDSA